SATRCDRQAAARTTLIGRSATADARRFLYAFTCSASWKRRRYRAGAALARRHRLVPAARLRQIVVPARHRTRAGIGGAGRRRAGGAARIDGAGRVFDAAGGRAVRRGGCGAPGRLGHLARRPPIPAHLLAPGPPGAGGTPRPPVVA